MNIHAQVADVVGRTPLVRLRRVVEDLPVTMLAKVESLNPGGSIKDRIGRAMIEEAERQGLLRPGGTIVEATAGNTGVGLAIAAAGKGYRCLFVVPDKMSQDKILLLEAYGAEVIVTRTDVPPDAPENYNQLADRLAREIPGAWRPNQFANPVNPEVHYRTTGPEIWQDTGGRVDVLVAGIGTGGTISGVGRFLKERNPRLVVVAADPEGSILSGGEPRPYLVEGIGEDFVPATFDRSVVDEFVRVTDREAFHMARRLAREEGLLVGGSSGAATAAAIRYARRLSGGEVVVVVMPDGGRNYLTRIFSDEWMRERGLLEDPPARRRIGEVLARCRPEGPCFVAVEVDDPISSAIASMERNRLSLMPVTEEGRIVGCLHEGTLVRVLWEAQGPCDRPVREFMGRPLPEVALGGDLEEARRHLLGGNPAVVVTDRGRPVDLLTPADLVRFLARRTDGESGPASQGSEEGPGAGGGDRTRTPLGGRGF